MFVPLSKFPLVIVDGSFKMLEPSAVGLSYMRSVRNTPTAVESHV